MAPKLPIPSSEEHLQDIGTQFQYSAQTRTNSRLREISQDLKDAIAKDKAENEQKAKLSSRPDTVRLLCHTHAHWTDKRFVTDFVRQTAKARKNHVLQRWLAEPRKEEAWNNVGEVTPLQRSLNDKNPKGRSQDNVQNCSNKAQDGSSQRCYEG
jgi:hypothetical protein